MAELVAEGADACAHATLVALYLVGAGVIAYLYTVKHQLDAA